MESVWGKYNRVALTEALVANDRTHVHSGRRLGKTRALLTAMYADTARTCTPGTPVFAIFVCSSKRTASFAEREWNNGGFHESDADGNTQWVALGHPLGLQVSWVSYDEYKKLRDMNGDKPTYVYIDESCVWEENRAFPDERKRTVKFIDRVAACGFDTKLRMVCTCKGMCLEHTSCLMKEVLSMHT